MPRICAGGAPLHQQRRHRAGHPPHEHRRLDRAEMGQLRVADDADHFPVREPSIRRWPTAGESGQPREPSNSLTTISPVAVVEQAPGDDGDVQQREQFRGIGAEVDAARVGRGILGRRTEEPSAEGCSGTKSAIPTGPRFAAAKASRNCVRKEAARANRRPAPAA